MDFPITIPLGQTTLPLHSVLEPAAFFIGFRYFLYLRRRQGDVVSPGSRIYILIGAIFGALIGAHLVGSLERPYELGWTDNLPAYIYGNKSVLGGFLGGLLGVEGVKKLIGETRASGDLFVYPMILALMIGRVGCFSMGVFEETYGLPTRLPWGMYLGDLYPRHPVMLYEIGFLALLWAGLHRLQRRFTWEAGARFKLFLIAYITFRFFVEFLKPRYPVLLGLSTIQWTAVLGWLYYIRYLIQPKKLLAAYA
ncbi:MAG TPA: prolipoprotein diacylglyceryl transferase family protein [Chitinophagaceae bacterium]|nr:prolipoprotein diacylglyceryl transferase family protein [Chitinophagaceae bacterium]